MTTHVYEVRAEVAIRVQVDQDGDPLVAAANCISTALERLPDDVPMLEIDWINVIADYCLDCDKDEE